MAKLSLELSDSLTELSRIVKDYTHEPRMLPPEDARTILEALTGMRLLARQMENEVSQHRWNQAAREEAAAAQAIMTEASRPGTNLRLLSTFGRPFSDGCAPQERPEEWR